MVRGWLSLLLFGTVSAILPRKSPPLGFKEVCALLVQQHNIESGPMFLFRLESAIPRRQWDPLSSKLQGFSLKIKETVCKGNPMKININNCAFKPNGVTKSCQGGYKYMGGVPKKVMGMIVCET
ncbi:batroxicidin-like [Anolis carolinensis]|uniref:batroxicidin-like n=1 Tax=Anolis carolinensis TaxID=28377 RepID=UPI002F2B1FD1